MPRIRTIKPEFPHSESIGRLSREARLLFIQLWTICDDSGRSRAASRMLASLLYPFDEDAPRLIEGWLHELEGEGCIIQYHTEGNTYLQVCNWLKHQKIDKPSKSRLPEFDEASRIFSKPREASAPDLGPRTVGPSTRDLGSTASVPEAARDAVVDAAALADRVLEIMGVRNDPRWFGDGGMIRAWLNGGADPELDIVPTVTAIMAKRNGQGPPSSLKYFSQAIADARASRLAGLPPAHANGASGGKRGIDYEALQRKLDEAQK